MSAEENLKKLGITLPAPAKPVAAYVPAVRTGNLLFVAGQIPLREGKIATHGLVGLNLTVEQAQEEARQCALNALAQLRNELGSLDRVARIVRVGVFVACTMGFTEHAKVANGASDLFLATFGDAGRHARTTVGVPGLPLGATVEVEVVAEVKP